MIITTVISFLVINLQAKQKLKNLLNVFEFNKINKILIKICEGELKLKYIVNGTIKKTRARTIIFLILIILVAFLLFIFNDNIYSYIFFHDNTVIEVSTNPKKLFNYPYLLYIPKHCNNKKNYLIIKPNTSGREQYYDIDDLKDAKKMLKKWVLTTSKYDLNSPVLVPVFPRPKIPEGPAWYFRNGQMESVELSKEEEYEEKMKAYYEMQKRERFDNELLNMIKDARKYLISRDIVIENKVIVFGYAHKYSLSNYFSSYHPKKCKLIAIDHPLVYINIANELLKENEIK